MHLLRTLLAVFGILVLIAGCNEQDMIDKLTPAGEAAIAKDIVSKLAAKDYAAIESQLDPAIRNASIHSALEQAAAAVPAGQPKNITTVGAHTSHGTGATSYNLTFEYEYPGAWMIANVLLQRRGEQVTVLGLHVNTLPQSLKDVNRFTFAGKGLPHYLVFALAVAIPLFIVYALIVCVRTPIAKRK